MLFAIQVAQLSVFCVGATWGSPIRPGGFAKYTNRTRFGKFWGFWQTVSGVPQRETNKKNRFLNLFFWGIFK